MPSVLQAAFLIGIFALLPGSSAIASEEPAEPQQTPSQWARLLSSNDAQQRIAAAKSLAQMGPQAKSAVPALIGALRDPVAAVQMQAAGALAEIGPDAEGAVPELIRSLQSADAGVRAHAAKAVGRIGPAAERAVPHLRPLLDDPDEQVRLQARTAIDTILKGGSSLPEGLSLDGPPRPDADPTGDANGEPESEEGPEAGSRPRPRPQPPTGTAPPNPAQQPERKTPQPKQKPGRPIPKKVQPPVKPQTIDDLIQALRSPENEVRRNAAIALGVLGKGAARAVPALQKARGDKDPRVDDAVFWALAWIRYGCDEGLKKLSIVGTPEKCPYVHGRIYWMGGSHGRGFQVLTDAGVRPGNARDRTFCLGQPANGGNSLAGHWGYARLNYFDLALFDKFRARLRTEGRDEAKLPAEQLLPAFLEDRDDQEETECVFRVSIGGATSFIYESWDRGFFFGQGPPIVGEKGPRQVGVSVVTSDCLRLDDTIEIHVTDPPAGTPPMTFGGQELPELIERSRRALSAGEADTEFSVMERRNAGEYLSGYLLEYTTRLMASGQHQSGQIVSCLQQGVEARRLAVARREEPTWQETEYHRDLSYLSAVASDARKLGDRRAYILAGRLAQFAASVPHEDKETHAETVQSIHSALADLAVSCSGDLEAAFEHELKGQRKLGGFRRLPPDAHVEPLNPETRWWLGWYGGQRPPSLEDLLAATAAPQEARVVARDAGNDDTEAEKSAREAHVRGLEWIKGVGQRLNDIRRKTAVLRAELAVQRIALHKTRRRIAYLEQILAKPGMARYLDHFLGEKWEELFGTPMPPEPEKKLRARIEKRVAELRAKADQILDQQDKQVQSLRDEYDEVFRELVAKGETAESADIQEFAGKLKQRVRVERGAAGMELYLAAGMREQFHDLARVFLEDPELAPATRLMQGLDYLENKRMRTALHAFKDCLARDPDNHVAREFIRQIEVGYLKAIDAKLMAYDKKTGITGDAAALRNACFKRMGEQGEAGFWNAIMDYFDGGLASVYGSLSGGRVSDVIGDPLKGEFRNPLGGYRGGLEDMMDAGGNMLDEAAVQHAGLLIITRLREKGLTLNEIRQLDNDQFIATIKEHFKPKRGTLIARLTQQGLKPDELNKLDDAALFELAEKHLGPLEVNISQEHALRMRRSVHGAFQNIDVDRLERGKTEQLNVDTGVSYFDAEIFEQSWSEWCCDAVNLKNIIIFLGPLSTVKAGGKLATTGSWGWIGEKAPESLLTVKDLVAGSALVQGAANKIGQNRLGGWCVEKLMNFDKSTGLISHMLADALVQQGMGMAGKYTGGYLGEKVGIGEKAGRRVGQFLGEVVAAYGGGDYDVAVKTFRNCGFGTDELGNVTRQLGKSLAEAQDALGRSRKVLSTVNEALDELSQTGKLSKSAREALQEGQQQIEEQISQLSKSFQGSEPSRFIRYQSQRLRLVQEAAKAAQEGNLAKARLLHEVSRQMGDQLDDYAAILAKQKQSCEVMEAKMREAASSGFSDSSPGKVKGAKSVNEALHDSGVEAYPPYRKYPVKHITESGHVREPLNYTGWEPDHLTRARKFDEAVKHYEEALVAYEAAGNTNDVAYEEIAEKLFLARQAAKAAKVARDEIDDIVVENMPLMKKIDDIDDLASGTDVRLVQMKKTSRNTTYWVEKKLDQGGSPVWKRVGVFKEADAGFPDGYDLRAERIYAEFAREVGLLAPACEEVNQIAGKQVRGLFVRLVEGTALDELDDVGMQIVLQKQIARHRVLAALLGDHDRYLRNFMLENSGLVASIDHGMTDVCARSNKELRKLIRLSGAADADPQGFAFDSDVQGLIVKDMRNRVVTIRDLANRQLKAVQSNLDAGNITLDDAAKHAAKARRLILLEEQIQFEHMVPTIRKIEQQLTDEKIAEILGRVFKGDELKEAIEILKVRRDHLFKVLEQVYRFKNNKMVLLLPAAGPAGRVCHIAPAPRPASLRAAA